MADRPLYTLAEIAEKTGIDATTLSRYANQYSDRIPFEGRGRNRRYHPEAIPIFRQIREAELSPKSKPSRVPVIIPEPVFTEDDRVILVEIGEALAKIGRLLRG